MKKHKEMFLENRIKYKNYDPSAAADEDKIFGLPHDEGDAIMHVIPVNSAMTVSGTSGAERGPEGLLEGSKCIELVNFDYPKDAWAGGMYLLPQDSKIAELHKKGQGIYKELTDATSQSVIEYSSSELKKVCEEMNERVEKRVKASIEAGHIVATVGGCHGSMFGPIRTQVTMAGKCTVLVIDAHLDLRLAYQEADYSHASVMRNVLNQVKDVKHMVFVGPRSIGLDEREYVVDNSDRISVFPGRALRINSDNGMNWSTICNRIIDAIPTDNVYISFDHDGFDVDLCPSTGTPVPDGLKMWEAMVLIERLARKRRIVGFDLNEMVPNTQVDRNSAAEIFYHMYFWTLVSRGAISQPTARAHADPLQPLKPLSEPQPAN